MVQYMRIMTQTGSYFAKEHIKKKQHKDKIRVIREDTVLEAFRNYKCEITVYFEDTEKTIHLTPYSDADEIQKYLGSKFLL